MAQFQAANLTDLTNRTATLGKPIYASVEEAFRNDCERAVTALRQFWQALATNQSGSTAPTPRTRGGLWADTSTAGAVALYGNPDGLDYDDQWGTRLTAKDISFATGGTATFKLGGAINVNTTQVIRSAPGVLMTYTLPGGTLANNGHVVKVIGFGVGAGVGGPFSLQSRIDATVLTTHGISGSSVLNWCAKIFIIRTGDATQECGSSIVLDTDASGSTTLCDFTTAAKALSGALAIDLNLSAITAGSVSQEISTVVYN